MGVKARSIEERFWELVDIRKPEECWPWKAGTNKKGYGRFQMGRTTGGVQLAHRVAWLLTYGEWPVPFALHACDNPPCCNPYSGHLFEGDAGDNARDMAAKGRTLVGWKFGEAHHNAVLNWTKVDFIRSSPLPIPTLAKLLGVSNNTVRQVVEQLTWKEYHRPRSST